MMMCISSAAAVETPATMDGERLKRYPSIVALRSGQVRLRCDALREGSGAPVDIK